MVAAVPFTLAAALWLFLEHADRSSWASREGPYFAVLGGIYLYGSIFALRGQLSLRQLVALGLVLNVVGAFIWVPALRGRDGWAVGYPGVMLAGLWVVALYQAFRDEWR